MRYLKYLFYVLLVIIIVCVSGGFFWGYNEFNRSGPLLENKKIIIKEGAGVDRIALSLGKNNVIKFPIIFSFAARALGISKVLSAGEFFFPQGVSPREVLEILREGKQVIRRITIPEGLTKAQVIETIKNTEGLVGDVNVALKEGDILPETYFFSYGDSRDSIVIRMKTAMKILLSDLWLSRSSDLPINTIKQAVILASIVEKETGLKNERARVAGVFINRLRLSMRLQSDPTVSYGITNGRSALGRVLSRKDLKAYSPYNTYVIKGLPLGPIANPGRAAITAVLHPINNGELYFVADGRGGHLFSSNLAQHNLNVKKWRKKIIQNKF
jgi:UPF0755 protein